MDLYLPRTLSSRQTQFLCLLAARTSLSRADYQRLMRVSLNTAKRDLADLLAARLVLALGATSGRRYILGQRALDPGSNNGRTQVGRSDPPPPQVRITVDPLVIAGRPS